MTVREVAELTISQALYVYCLGKAGEIDSLGGQGLEEAPLAVASRGGLAAVVSVVPLDVFAGPGSDQRLADVAWVAPRTIRHNEVVERAAALGAVLPARFGTLFSSRAELERWIDRHAAAAAEALDALAGRAEWGVRVELDRGLASDAGEGSGEAAAVPAAGAAYLRRKAERAARDRELDEVLVARCTDAARGLARHATDFRELRVSGVAPAGQRDAVASWAFLVAEWELDGFRAYLEGLAAAGAESGLSFTLTGPWPPYSFCPELVLPPEQEAAE